MILLGAFGSGAADAATRQPGDLAINEGDIESLVREALEKNPELNFYRAEVTVAKAGRKAAGLWANPEVNSSMGYKKSRERGSGLSAEGVAWSASVVQPFEWPGRLGLRKAIANREIELGELGLERFRSALAARVRLLGYGLLAAQAKAEGAREVAERFKTLREMLVQRDPAGLTPLLETRVIEATELTMQRKATEAELASQAALLELNQLRGGALNERRTIREPRFEFRPHEAIEALLAMAQTNNFELRVRASELAQQGFRVALAKNERFPTISAGPSISEENAFERERVLGIGISLPLPLWNRNSANIDSAAARKVQAETSLLVAQREVERKVIEAAGTYELKLTEIGKWRPDAAEHFRNAAELADRHYRLGAVPVSTYVELQKSYLDAVEGLFDSRKEALDAAQNLELLTGLKVPLVVTREKEER